MKKKISFLLVGVGLSQSVQSGDIVPGNTENSASGSVSSEIKVGNTNAGIKANIDGNKSDFEATGGYGALSHTTNVDLNGNATNSDKLSIGKSSLESGCKNNGQECETKKESLFGFKEEKNTSNYKEYGHNPNATDKANDTAVPSTKDKFDSASKQTYLNNPINQPVENNSTCIKYKGEAVVGGKIETCYEGQNTSAAEQSFCKTNPDDPFCTAKPSGIKSETSELTASGSPLPGKVKQKLKDSGGELDAKAGVEHKIEYSTTKQDCDEQTAQALSDLQNGRPGSSQNLPCYREETDTVFGEINAEFKGKVGDSEVNVTPLKITGKLPSTTRVYTSVDDALKKNDDIQLNADMESAGLGVNDSEYSLKTNYLNNKNRNKNKQQDAREHAAREEQAKQAAIDRNQLSRQPSGNNIGSFLNGLNAITNGALMGMKMGNALNNPNNGSGTFPPVQSVSSSPAPPSAPYVDPSCQKHPQSCGCVPSGPGSGCGNL